MLRYPLRAKALYPLWLRPKAALGFLCALW